ncbi:Copia protein [Symbiodinium microadriaticum]|uniref:Copia protein n=1 Tax=Symbiodinium microadriaticum TaxID=2951 RepID=A0A1Q9ELQ6_SYMMI|nr:Copia protein [Symbiodinium microadriaticum]
MEENSCAMEVLRRRRSTSVVRERAASEGNDNVDAAAVMQEPGSGALEVRGEAGPSGAQGPNPFWSPRAQQAFADHQRRLQGVSADPGHIPALALGDADSNQQRLVAPAGQPVVFGPTAVSSRIEVGLDGSLQNQRELNDRELGENASPGSEASFLSRLEKGVEPGISPAESQEPELIPGGLDEGPARTPAELRHLIKGLWEESQRLNARVQYLESKTSSQRTSTNSAASVRDLPASPETAEQHDGDAKSQESQGVQGRGRDSVATGGLSRGVANSRDRDLRASPVQPLFPEGGAPTTSALLDVKLPVGEGRSAVAYPGQAAREWVDRLDSEGQEKGKGKEGKKGKEKGSEELMTEAVQLLKSLRLSVDVDPYAWLRERVKHYVNKHADLTPVDLGRFLQGQDFLKDGTFAYLAALAADGKADNVLLLRLVLLAALAEVGLKVTDEVLEDIGDPGEDEEPLFEELLESCASAPPVPESQIAPPAADSETTALESQVAVDKLVPPVRTLRFARVLKSRSSHEIAFHLAVMISRIRSLGFPVTRLHSDRAREIRAPHVMQVVSALGVYATQTAGESPQSNGRAENAISWLKRRAKTLLFASKLAVEYWPFAVRYAVEQNLREQLLEMGGTTLPPQIPFGSEVQAKLRSWKRPEGLGRKAVWSAETVRAVALGTPPDTVNGQVVSLPDGPLVVAATVFPMPVVPPIKPVYRLTDKTAPDEVVTELRSKPHHSADKPAEDDPEEFRPAEAPVSHRMRGKSSPASVSWIRAFCPGTEWGESDVDFYFDADSLSAVPREEISEGIGRECWDESLVELPGRNEGLRDFEENDGSEEEEHEDGSKDSRLSKLEGEGRGRIESAAKEVLEGGWSVENAREVIAMAAQFLQGYARTGAVGEGEEAGYQSFGLFSHGGVVGVTKHTAMFPSLTKLLTSWVQHHFPDDGFSTVTISSGIRMKRHLDKFNLGGTSNLVTLISGDYDRDGVWIQGAGPDEQSAPVWLDGHQGHVRPIGRQGCKLNPRVYHATAPDACVDGRCLVVGYTKSAIRKATHAQLDELVGVGFPVDRILGRQEKAQLEVEVELPNLEASEVLAESIERLATQAASELHCVKQTLFPIAESLDMSLVKAYDQAAKWAKGLELAERVLRDCVDPPCVRAMSTLNPPGHHTLGSPANTEADVQQEIFLQTKTVALDEVRKQLVDWIPSMTKEYNSITKEKEAVEVTSEERVNQLIEQGIVREVLPGKLVATRKAGAGLRKSRICICGNFQEFDPNEPLNASGVEATTLRALLRVAALNSWTFAAGDVSTAFLNAPITGGTNQDGQEVLIAVRPPSILITAGVCGPKERWLVRRALYGLRAAPRAWAAYRDKQLQQLEIQVDGQETLRLHQSENDPNLWSVCKGSQVRAWVLCYVDDLLVVGPSVVVERVKQGLSGLWKMGTWDSPSDGKAVKYCGMQLFRDPDGTIRIGQQSFVEDLLKRHEVPSDLKAATPLASWEDPLPEENVQLSDVRRAQGIAGEVQWLVSRSRPDLLYAASKLSIWSTRAPTAVWKAAQGVLKYLNATKEMYLVYPPTVPPLGENAHLPFARTPDILEIQVDASHAPQGGRSHQTAIIMHMGCAVAWEAARQTITALSSAESELIAAISGMQLGESMLSLVAELTGLSISPIELTDNAAAVSVLTGEQTAWKGRHLRMRGAALRERVHSNSWRVLHIPGEMNGADIGTKPLGGARLKRLAELIGLRLGGEVEASLSSLNAVADAPKRERTTCISSGTHGAGTTLRKLLLLLLVVQTARAEGDTESSSESQSWETLFLIVMCIFVWEAVKLTGRRLLKPTVGTLNLPVNLKALCGWRDLEVGSRAGGSDAHDAQGGFQGGAGAVWDHEIQEYDVADAYWTVGPVEGTPGVEGDAQDAQLALDAGQSEVVANPWGEGGNGWASSTVDAPSEEERGHRASPDTLADELLRQGFFRLQEFPGDHFYWLVFPSPGIELPFYAEVAELVWL